LVGGVAEDDREVRVACLQRRAEGLGIEALGLGGDEEIRGEARHRLEGLVLVARGAHLVLALQESPESCGHGRTRIGDDDPAQTSITSFSFLATIWST